jgi:hypothetical protein
MILTFGVEKSLKALRRHIDGVEPPYGHNLVDLFEELGEETRNWVALLSGAKPRHFRAALADNQDGFEEWRYAEERDGNDDELVLSLPNVFIGVMEAALLFLRREVEGLPTETEPG